MGMVITKSSGMFHIVFNSNVYVFSSDEYTLKQAMEEVIEANKDF